MHTSRRIQNYTKMLRQILISALIGLTLSASPKIDGNLQQVLAAKETANVVISFYQSIEPVLNKIEAIRFETRGAKITVMKQQLELLAESSQKDVIRLLKARSISYQSFWVNNRVFVKNADLALVNAIAAVSDVIEVREEVTVYLDNPIWEKDEGINGEWGMERIQAEEAWALPGGNNGAGVVVSNIDTGVRYTHEALRNNFRADHGWFDPYENASTPVDTIGHGTHTIGTIAGSGGIGVAPGAQWISCRGCHIDRCKEDAVTSCGQWILCPTNADGSDPDCSMAPVVTSCSWGGGQDRLWFNPVVLAWHTAGIIPVFSQGNSGPSCGSANSPGDMTNVIGVGSTDDTNVISSYSSRGPARNGAIKPDISAPGRNVRSSYNTDDTAYYVASGTSMSAPHTSGVVGLLKAHNANLSYEQIKSLIQDSATRTGLGMATYCGGIPITEFPNNVYGHGLLNAKNALSAAINGFPAAKWDFS